MAPKTTSIASIALFVALLPLRGSLGLSIPSKQPAAAPYKNSFDEKEIYGIPFSGWSSPEWKWGSADGTAHECAKICRERYDTPESRTALIENLLLPKEEIQTMFGESPTDNGNDNDVETGEEKTRIPLNFEEVKLIMALAFQKARKLCYGGLESYGEVLDEIVLAERYEEKSSELGDEGIGTNTDLTEKEQPHYQYYRPSLIMVQDMQKRSFWLDFVDMQDKIELNMLLYDGELDYDWIRRRCCGFVLKAMDFEEMGL